MAIKSVCNTCGMTLNEKASFCPTCGSRMNIIEEQSAPMTEPMSDAMTGATESMNAENMNASAETERTASNNPALDAAMNNGSPAPNAANIPPMGSNIPPVPPVNASPMGNNSNIPPVPPSNTYGYQPQQPQNQTPKSAKDTMALVGMILGIVSLVLCCLNLIDLPIAIAGLILSIIGVKSTKRGGMAIAGIICSGIAAILCLIIFFAGVSEMSKQSSYYSDIFEDIFEDELDDDFDDFENYVYKYDWD